MGRPDLWGHAISQASDGLEAGTGLLAGTNTGDEAVVLEPACCTASDQAGENEIDPMTMMLSAARMPKYTGKKVVASTSESTITLATSESKAPTSDLESDPTHSTSATTSRAANAVCIKLKEARDYA